MAASISLNNSVLALLITPVRLPAIFCAALSTSLSTFTSVFNTGSMYPSFTFSSFCIVFIKFFIAFDASPISILGIVHSVAFVSVIFSLFCFLPIVSASSPPPSIISSLLFGIPPILVPLLDNLVGVPSASKGSTEIGWNPEVELDITSSQVFMFSMFLCAYNEPITIGCCASIPSRKKPTTVSPPCSVLLTP